MERFLTPGGCFPSGICPGPSNSWGGLCGISLSQLHPFSLQTLHSPSHTAGRAWSLRKWPPQEERARLSGVEGGGLA